MQKKPYLPRLCDAELKIALSSAGAVLIEGAKWCGKTSTASRAAGSVAYMQDPDQSASYKVMADAKPSLLLQGQTPRLIDEWQVAPVIWDAVRFEVDKRDETGQFILTGSAVPLVDGTTHTGTGRIARLKMRPMSLFESGESSGAISLQALFEGSQESSERTAELSIERLAWVICRGGWPASLKLEDKPALRMASDYVESMFSAT